MNKFEDHWREKLNDPERQKGFLKEKVRTVMWEKIQASKSGFELDWQKKADDIKSWDGVLTEAGKEALWHQLQVPLAQFELYWRDKMEEAGQENCVFLDEAAKARIAATVFAAKQNFEADWQEKINDPVLAGPELLDAGAKNRIWDKVQSANSNTAASTPGLKRKPLFALRWSHAAALLIGAFSTWLIWDRSSTPLQNTLVVNPQPELPAPVVSPAETQKEIIPDLQKESARVAQGATSRSLSRPIAKVKTAAPLREREVVARVAGKVPSVKPLQSAVVLAKTGPVANTGKTIPAAEKAGSSIQEQDIEVAIAKAPPAKKVVHISDIRPAEVPVKGTAIYGRAFGAGKERGSEKSTMTFNSVLKNYR